MVVKLANNAISTITTSITAVATTLAVQAADAGKFPVLAAGDWHPATIIDAAGNMEIVRVTGRNGNLLTVVRAQEATTAKAFSAGARIDVRLTAGAFAQTANLVPQTSPSDNTPNRLLTVGAFGLGAGIILLDQNDDINNLPAGGQYGWADVGTIPANAPADSAYSVLENIVWADGGPVVQRITGFGLGNVRYRFRSGSGWSPFKPMGTVTDAQLAALAAIVADPWETQPVGVPVPQWFGLPNTGYIAKDNPRYRYIILSGGAAGAGGFNEGIITSEVVTGTWPNIDAYGTINFPSSPFHGSVVPLINTSRMFLRPGSGGTQQYFAMQAHSHGVNDPGHVHGGVQNGQSSTGRSTALDQPPAVFSFGNTWGAATGIWLSNTGEEETRPRNIGLQYVMRIK